MIASTTYREAHGRHRMATAACALWPQPAVWTDVGELILLVFTHDGVPTWEVSRRAKAGSSREDLIASGKADTFKAAKAAALFEARARSSE